MNNTINTGLSYEIAKNYKHLPYHNWSHAKKVWEAMRLLENDFTHISSGEMAWYLHDAGHTWVAKPDDEEKSCEIAEKILTDWNSSNWYIDDVKNHIMGTVFSERINLILPEQKLMADADISSIWSNYSQFIKSSIAFLLEISDRADLTDNRIIEYFWVDQMDFFKYLTSVTGQTDNPFLTKSAQKLFPNFSQNKIQLTQHIEENPDILIELTRNSERNFYVKWHKSIF
jgi:predicted metal-dependent HD superfamily phosphohydrolase